MAGWDVEGGAGALEGLKLTFGGGWGCWERLPLGGGIPFMSVGVLRP